MKFLFIILLAGLIFDGLAAPVKVGEAPKPKPKTLRKLSNDVLELLSKLEQWRYIPKWRTSLLPERASAYPIITNAFEIMNDFFQYPESREASRVMGQLNEVEKTLDLRKKSPDTIAFNYCSFDDGLALDFFRYRREVQRLKMGMALRKIDQSPETDLRTFMNMGWKDIKDKKKCEMLSNLYETKKSAEQTMSQSFENLRTSLLSLDQIDHFITLYDIYYNTFYRPKEAHVFREYRFPLDVSSSDLLAKSSSQPGPSFKRQKLNNGLNTDESSTLISDPNSDSEPSSKLQMKKNALPNIFDKEHPYNEQIVLLFVTLVGNPTHEIAKKLDNWRLFVKANQPIVTSELFSALNDCIKMMKNLEAFLPYSSFLTDALDASFIAALKTTDGFYDLLRDSAALFVFPLEKFCDLKKISAEVREQLLMNPILPSDFFESPIFIEFCTTYLSLLLQNNCHKMQMKPASLVNPKDFVAQNRGLLKMIKMYQSILELPSLDQLTDERNDEIPDEEFSFLEEDDRILKGYKTRALIMFKKNLKSFLECDEIHSAISLEEFFEANKKLVKLMKISNISNVFGNWMEYHVSQLLGFSRLIKDASWPNGRRYHIAGLGDKEFEFRRLYMPFSQLGSDSSHNIQSIHSNCNQFHSLDMT